jgi:hypothetical protein
MAEIVLHQPRIGTLVGQGKAAGMAELMRVRLNKQACAGASKSTPKISPMFGSSLCLEVLSDHGSRRQYAV